MSMWRPSHLKFNFYNIINNVANGMGITEKICGKKRLKSVLKHSNTSNWILSEIFTPIRYIHVQYIGS